MTAVLLATVSVAASHDIEQHIKQEYLKFVATYGKSYVSMDHMDERYGVFKQNYLKIARHNNSSDEIGRPAPFKMAVNRFTDMTEEEFVAERLDKAGALPKHQREKRKVLKSIN